MSMTDSLLLKGGEMILTPEEMAAVYFTKAKPTGVDTNGASDWQYERAFCKAQLDKLASMTDEQLREEVEKIAVSIWHEEISVTGGVIELLALFTAREQEVKRKVAEEIKRELSGLIIGIDGCEFEERFDDDKGCIGIDMNMNQYNDYWENKGVPSGKGD